MFTEVIKLKGLIIYLNPHLFGYDHDWTTISNLIPCVFVVENDLQLSKLRNNVSANSKFIINSFPQFGLVQTVKTATVELDVNPCEVACLTNDINIMKTVINEPIGTILYHPIRIPFEFHGFAPDFIIGSIEDLNKAILDNVKGYFSEVCLTAIKKDTFYGSSGFWYETELPDGPSNVTVYLMGRYYDPGHPKYNSHQLSHRIRRSKKDVSQEKLFIDVFKPFIEMLSPDGVTRVPPRPSKTRDRLSNIVSSSVDGSNIENLCSSLACIREYSDHKSLGREARYANVKGAFKAKDTVRDKHIVLIDDVLTTGATVYECASELIKVGARRVSILVLASHQFNPNWSNGKQLPCPNPECDGHLILTLKKDNSFFYGCSNFSKTNCKGSQFFLPGWHSFCRLNTRENIGPDFSDFELDF